MELLMSGKFSFIAKSEKEPKEVEVECCSCELENLDKEDTKANWIDCGSYWLLDAPQKSKIWKETRLKLLTASNVAYALNLAPQFHKPEDIAEVIRKGIEKTEINEHISRGIEREPMGCRFYRSQKQCKVKHIGLAVPKWDTRIGGSTDGIPLILKDGKYVDDGGSIEIKAPRYMYPKIVNYVRSTSKPKDFEHIYITHRVQMMTNSRILERKQCDYIVYAPDYEDVEENAIGGFIQTYPYDQEEWEPIYEEICDFFDTWLPGYKSGIVFPG